MAESCTSGSVSSLLTSVRALQPTFTGGVVAYNNDIKINLLGVKEETILNQGAVSCECVKEMAVGIGNS